jgi:hypothetical protein
MIHYLIYSLPRFCRYQIENYLGNAKQSTNMMIILKIYENLGKSKNLRRLHQGQEIGSIWICSFYMRFTVG